MKPPVLFGAIVVLCLAAGSAPSLAQTKTDGAGQTSARPRVKPKRTVRPQPEAARAPGSAGNLNAPSTNFNDLSPAGEEPSRRGEGGPPIRGSVNSNGQPEMGLGF